MESTSKFKSLERAIDDIEAILGGDFEGKTVREIYELTETPIPTTWRILKTLEKKGWVVGVGEPGSKAVRWMVGPGLIRIAITYKRQALTKRQEIESEYFQNTGEELKT